MSEEDIYQKALDSIELLRDNGFAVSIFFPKELEGEKADTVADRMVEAGWDMIEYLKANPNG